MDKQPSDGSSYTVLFPAVVLWCGRRVQVPGRRSGYDIGEELRTKYNPVIEFHGESCGRR